MYRTLCLIVLALLLAACAPAAVATPDELPTAAPTRTPGGPTLTPISFIPPETTPARASEILRFEGQGAGQGGPLRLDAETTLRIHWEQFDETSLRIWVVNTDPNQSDPRYKKISVAFADVPSFGYTDVPLIAGEYRIEVESAGKWQVWVELLQP
jgi:hypothetical protein